MDLGRTSRIFSKVAEVGPDFIASSFGKVGEKIFFLFESLGNHPESDAHFFDECDVALRELFELANQAKSKGMSSFLSKLPEMAEMFSSERLKSARIPRNNSYAARLLRKPMKDHARSIRLPQRLGSHSFMEFLAKSWNCCPSDFSGFRNNLSPATPPPLQDMVRGFEKMGCPFLAEASKEIFFRYFRPIGVRGYKKLSIADACCILAKSMGLAVRERIVAARSASGWFRYSPFVIPLPMLEPTERVSARVQESEFNSELYFDAVFDHHLVVVPFLGSRLGRELSGEVNFPDVKDCFSSLKDGTLPAVVLGERDGECYFLCEWN